MFQPGKGPTVKGEALEDTNGAFQAGSNSSTLEIDDKVLQAFESGEPGSTTLLESTVEHEATPR